MDLPAGVRTGYAGQRAPQRIRGHRRQVRPTAREPGEASVGGLAPCAVWSSTRAERMLADVQKERATPSHTGDNGPEKGVLSLVELTLRARSSALEAKATEA